MKYALLNNERIEPQKGIKNAVCPVCGETVIPKCGIIKMHHWAHKNKQNCDPWWENETEWHRQWKDNFPKEWQEYIMHDKDSGEKHVADIRTNTGIVVEFQHSYMNYKEQESRENFYKNMIWVVDARKYYKDFKDSLYMLNHCKSNINYFYLEPDIYMHTPFPEKWLDSTVPVIFDFGIFDKIQDNYDKQKKWLWCLFPEAFYTKLSSNDTKIQLCGLYIKKETFIKRVSENNSFFNNIVLSELHNIQIEKQREQEEQERKDQEEYKKWRHKKYSQEHKWREAIINVRKQCDLKIISPLKLYTSNDGTITDYTHSQSYNNCNCMVLGIKTYDAQYKGKRYKKNDVLLLIELKDKFILGVIYVPTSILNGDAYWEGICWGNYNYYIRTITTLPHYYGKYAVWFTENDRIWTTKKIKTDLKIIRKTFSLD